MKARIAMLLIVSLALLSLVSCTATGSENDPEAAVTEPLSHQADDVISASGQVRPARWAGLGFPVGGTASLVHVEEGQEVVAGQPLMELTAVQLERAVAEADAALAAAEAGLAQVKAGAPPQEIAAAEEAVLAALANVTVAQAQVSAARANLGQAQSGVAIAAAQEAVAQAGVKVAQAELDRAQAGAAPSERAAAQARLDKVRAAVRLAQAEYDRIGGATNTPQALALEQATLDLEIAQAEYDLLIAGPRPSDLAPLRAGVEAARAQSILAQAQADQARNQIAQAEAAVAQAEAGVEAARAQAGQAQAALDRLQAGPTPEEVAAAEAAVTQARERLASAEALLAQATLRAPFDGTIGLIQVRQGEEVLPGQTVIMLGDLSTLQVETTDLDEIDVARVRAGQRVDLTLDALPDQVLSGRVARVAPLSTLGQTATTYAVIVEFEETDPDLRWGMTAFVDIWVE